MKTFKDELTLKNYKLLFECLYPRLSLLAYKYVNNLDLAKDLVQKVFIKVWEDQVAFKNESQAANFFYTAVKNKGLNLLKSKLY